MYSLRIALRYLFARKSHNAVNIISVVSMVGVAVATAAIVCVLSVFNGFTDLSMSNLSETSPDVRVLPAEGKTIADADSLAARLTRLPQVKAALPAVAEDALAIYRGRQMPVRLIGLSDPQGSVIDLEKTLVDGEIADAVAADSSYRCAALSIGVAARLNAHPQFFEWLALYAPRRRGRINTANPMASFVSDSLVVSGVYETKDVETDGSSIVVPLDVARRLFEYTTEASSVDIRLADGINPDEGADAISAALGSGYIASTRLRQHESSFRMISIEKWITFAMLAFILLIASFNVISTLSMLIIEKDENIATLRAMGVTTAGVRRIFVIEGWLITMTGAMAGVIVGIALSLAQQYGGFIKLNGDPAALAVTDYPVRLQATDIVAILLLTAFVGWLVGYAASLFISRRDR